MRRIKLAQNNDVSIEQYAKYIEEEEHRQELYLTKVFAKKVSEPVPPTKEELSFWRIAGLESSLFVMSGIGSAILSAIRTGGLFWLLEELLFKKFEALAWASGLFGFASMVAALMAFEGFLLAYGLTKGKESGKMEVSTTGLWISLVTVMAAGIFSSFSIVNVSDGWQSFMNIILALITGGASALVAYFSSENLGFIMNHINARKQEIQDAHTKAVLHWREQGIKSYTTARKGIMANASSYNISVSNNTQVEQSTQEEQKKKSKAEIAYGAIQSYYNNNNGIPTNQYVVDNTGVALGSAHTAIENFKINNKEELLFKGIVTQDEITKLMSKRGIGVAGTYEASIQKITDFIRSNEAFPKSEDIKRLDIPLDDVARFVVENEEALLNRNIVDEKIVMDAKNHLNK